MITGKEEIVDVSHKIFSLNCLFKQHVTEWAIPTQHAITFISQMKEWLDRNDDVKVSSIEDTEMILK